MRHLRDHIELKSLDEIGLMREAGLVVARASRRCVTPSRPASLLADLDAIARDVLADEGASVLVPQLRLAALPGRVIAQSVGTPMSCTGGHPVRRGRATRGRPDLDRLRAIVEVGTVTPRSLCRSDRCHRPASALSERAESVVDGMVPPEPAAAL